MEKKYLIRNVQTNEIIGYCNTQAEAKEITEQLESQRRDKHDYKAIYPMGDKVEKLPLLNRQRDRRCW